MKSLILFRAAVLLPMCAALPVAGCKKEETPAAQSSQGPAPTAPVPSTPAPAAAMQQFTWKDVTLSHPKSWKAADRQDAGGAEVVGPRDEEWEPNLFLRIHPNTENESAGEILQERMIQLGAKPSYSLTAKHFPLKLPSGLEYARLAYKSKDETGRFDLAHWYVVIPLPDKRWLEIQANAAEETWDRQQPVIEQIINSIQFKK